MHLLQSNYGIRPLAVVPLDGYESENYLIESENGRFILKIHRDSTRARLRACG